jgi:CBS domain-containing protein
MPLVSELMTRSLLTVPVDATLGEAAAAMVERGVGAVVVLENDAIAAILTERDVMKAVAAGKDAVRRWPTG